mgnify:CR=1 FL=1
MLASLLSGGGGLGRDPMGDDDSPGLPVRLFRSRDCCSLLLTVSCALNTAGGASNSGGGGGGSLSDLLFGSNSMDLRFLPLHSTAIVDSELMFS